MHVIVASHCKRMRSIQKEPVLPFVARLRGLTYCASVLVDLVHDIQKTMVKLSDGFIGDFMAKITMLKTKYCGMMIRTTHLRVQDGPGGIL